MPTGQKLSRQEYKKLKKEQKRTRIAGVILLVIGVSLYPLMMLINPVLMAFAAFPTVAGFVLLLRSMAHRKFAPLWKAAPAKPAKAKKKQPEKPAERTQERQATPVKAHIPAKKTEASMVNKKIFGCLLGGAAGDALGYAVEFLQYDQIVRRYGEAGIRSYEYAPSNGKALISDDTQMTLFTAEGLLYAEGDDVTAIYRAYLNWLETQRRTYESRGEHPESPLMRNPELYSRRAPGNTCLSALSSGIMGTVKVPINSSKGCGGVMRVAPVAFLKTDNETELDKLAAQAAAITHGHPLGYLPAALLVHILHRSIYGKDPKKSLRAIVEESVSAFEKIFEAAPYLEDLLSLVKKAIKLSGNRDADVENIHALGEGWVAEETLAIAIYCALRHADDFSAALTAAVNHNGDSDSTGAVAGNLLGAYLGEDAIGPEWRQSLELYDVLLQYATRFGE